MNKLWVSYLESMFNDESKIKKYVNVAGAIIIKEGENGEKLLLLIRRSPDDHWPLHWEIPRGKCDKGKDEPLLKCVIRETKEETQLDIEPIKFIDKFEYIADRGTRKSTQYNYLCKLKNPNQKVVFKKTPGGVKEHTEYRWVMSLGEVEMMVNPELKRTISKIFNQDTKIIEYGDEPSQNNIKE